MAASVWVLTVGEMVRHGQARPLFLFGSTLVMAGMGLLTPLATLMLPLYLGLAFFPSGTSGQRGRWVLLLTSGWLIAQTARFILSPQATWSLWALWLRPWFGARWFLSILWFLAVMPLGVLAWRWLGGQAHQPRPVRPRQTLTGALLPMAAIWLLLLAACYRWGLPGQDFLGRSLFFGAAVFSGLTAVLRTWVLWRSGSRKGLALAWLALACLLGWGAFGMAALGRAPSPSLETAWEQVGTRDLLFVPHGPDTPFQAAPLSMARTGRLQSYTDLWALRDRLTTGRQEIRRSHHRLWVLTRQGSLPPWLVPLPDLPIAPTWILCRVDLSRDPGPLTLFAEGQPALTGAQVAGLHTDGIWTQHNFSLNFAAPLAQPRYLEIVLRGWRPTEVGPLDDQLQVTLNGRDLELVDHQLTFFRWQIPANLLTSRGNLLVIQAPTFVPRAVDRNSADGRELGIDLETIVLR